MQDEMMPDPGRMLDDAQRLVLCALLAGGGGSGVCSMPELALEVGDRDAAELAVVGLHAAGLVHRLEGFVFATHAAVRLHELRFPSGPRARV